jgi:hypothetical protein
MKDLELISSFAISVLSVYSSFINWKVYEVSRILFYYFILDTYLSILSRKYDILIHHGFSFIMYGSIYIFSVGKEDFLEFFKTIVLLETSSIFLIINKAVAQKKIHMNNYLKTVNTIFFVWTFFYYRLYYYYYYILSPNGLLDMYLFKYAKNDITRNLFYFNTYGFYLLNIYWSLLIISKFLHLCAFEMRKVTVPCHS